MIGATVAIGAVDFAVNFIALAWSTPGPLREGEAGIWLLGPLVRRACLEERGGGPHGDRRVVIRSAAQEVRPHVPRVWADRSLLGTAHSAPSA